MASISTISLPMSTGIHQMYGVDAWRNTGMIVFIESVDFLITLFLVILIFVVLLIYHKWRRGLIAKMLSQKNLEIKNSKVRELEKNRKIQSMQALMKIQEAERINAAKDLQDSLGGLLSSVKMQYAGLSHAKDSSFSKVEALIDESCNELRRVALKMMPDALIRFGLVNALEDLAGKLETDGKLSIDIQAIGMNYRLESSTETEIYRIIYDLLDIVIQRGHAKYVLIQLALHGDKLNIIIEDDGPEEEQDRQSKNGIDFINVESRVMYLNGRIEYDSYGQSGKTVTIDIQV